MRTLLLAVTSLLLAAAPAAAGTWDLDLARLCRIQTSRGGFLDCGGGFDPARHGRVEAVQPDNAAFRALMSELGIVFAPNLLAPAETTGLGGFHFGVELGLVTVNPRKNADSTFVEGGAVQSLPHWFWRAAESVGETAFRSGDIRNPDAVRRIGDELPPSVAPTVTVMVRKGLWFPVPSFELGVGVRHLIDSRMWAPILTAKLAIHEGFQGFPVPAIAVRGSATRVMGTPGFNLTVAAVDASLSKHIGIASTFNITPFAGYQLLWIIADSEVLDAAPGQDAIGTSIAEADKIADPSVRRAALTRCRGPDQGCNAFFAFLDQPNIVRHRFFIGVKANFYVVSFTAQYSYFAQGSDVARVLLPNLKEFLVPDGAGDQHAVNLALSVDY